MEFIMMSRSSWEGANGKRMPMPRSKPSSSTYRPTENATVSANASGRSKAIALLRRFRPRGGGIAPGPNCQRLARRSWGLRPGEHHAHRIMEKRREQDDVDNDEERER